MIYRMGRGRPKLSLLALLSLAVASPVSAQSYDQDSGVADDDGALVSDDGAWFDEEPAPAPEPQVNEALAPSEIPPDDADPRALTDFKPDLDPYGTWVQDPVYGTVWVPSPQVVGDSFSPYVTGGRWALSTNNEWVWVSDYPFGPVVYHYGRWVYITGTGWAWIPGYRYAPAWVTFRVPTGSYAYVGWAPLPPDYIWVNGVAVHFHVAPSYYWVFCPSAYVFHSHVNYYVVRDRVFVGQLAYHTRHYHVHHHSPAPRYRVPASPSPRLARVPARAVPAERVPLQPSPRVRADARAHAGASVSPSSRARADVARKANVTRIAPGTADRRAAAVAPSRTRIIDGGSATTGTRPTTPVVGERDTPRSAPSTRSAAPARPSAPVRTIAPTRPTTPAPTVEAARPQVRPVAPSTPGVTPPVRAPSNQSVAPAVRSVTPAPSNQSASPPVRSVAPSNQSVAPAVRSVAPSTRSVSPPARSVAPSTRSVAPAVRSVAPSNHSVAPVRSVAPAHRISPSAVPRSSRR
jgi:hypothetical protein